MIWDGWACPSIPEGVYRVRVTAASHPCSHVPRTRVRGRGRDGPEPSANMRVGGTPTTCPSAGGGGGADPTHFGTLRVHGDRDRPHTRTRPRRKVATRPSTYPALSHQHESQRLHSCATYEPSPSKPGRPSLHRQPRPKQATRSGVCKDVSRHRERRYAVNDSRYPRIWRPVEAAAVSGTPARQTGGHL